MDLDKVLEFKLRKRTTKYKRISTETPEQYRLRWIKQGLYKIKRGDLDHKGSRYDRRMYRYALEDGFIDKDLNILKEV